MLAHFDPHPADTNQLRPVHPQCRNCRSANWRQSNDLSPLIIPGEMFFPLLLVRMKKEHLFLSQRVCYRLAACFVTVTRRAGQASVFENSFTPGRAWNDVLDLIDGNSEPFCCAAISAAISKMLANLTSQFGRDVKTHVTEGDFSW